MLHPNSALEPALQDLEDAVADFRQAPYQNGESILRRFVQDLDNEPLAGFIAAALPPVDFEGWLANAESTGGSMAGSGRLDFPADRTHRVAIQMCLVRALSEGKPDLTAFTHHYCNAGYNQISAHYTVFAETVLDPALRDLRKIAEKRTLPPILFQAMGKLPTSGDAKLDVLLDEAINKFKDPAPSERREAVERLWDAWERLKSLEDTNKRLSLGRLLDGAADEPHFRQLLETEARQLTDVGNQFHIRHFEKGHTDITRAEHLDYLFHRLYALIHLVLYTRRS